MVSSSVCACLDMSGKCVCTTLACIATVGQHTLVLLRLPVLQTYHAWWNAFKHDLMQALEEAHECVSEYHRKLGAMERTVGHALVARGDLKDAQERAAEASSLAAQYKETLGCAEARIAALQLADRTSKEKICELQQRDEQQSYMLKQLREAAGSASQDAAAAAQAQMAADAAEARADKAECASRKVEAARAEALDALAGVVSVQREGEANRVALLDHVQELEGALRAEQVCLVATSCVAAMICAPFIFQSLLPAHRQCAVAQGAHSVLHLEPFQPGVLSPLAGAGHRLAEASSQQAAAQLAAHCD